MKKKLAVVITHPIQYYSPVFRLLTSRNNLQLKVFYTWEPEAAQFDSGFGKEFSWDIPLLEGYEYEFISNEGRKGKDFMSVRNPGLNKEIERWEPDMVLVYGWNYRSHFSAMRYFKGRIPVLFRGDSTMLDKIPAWKGMLRKQVLRFVYRNIDHALFVGANNKKYFEAHGVKNEQLSFVPHSIENKRFQECDQEHRNFVEETRTRLGLTNDKLTIVYVGKFVKRKNPMLLLDAVLGLKDTSIQLLMIGNGEMETELKERAAGASNIHFLPFQNQRIMPAVYRLGDVFCLPSAYLETWGLAVNEAMACGRVPVVSDKVGCAADLVKNDFNGFVFQSGDINSLQQILMKLKHRQLVLQMASRSEEMIENWSIPKQVEAIEKLVFEQF